MTIQNAGNSEPTNLESYRKARIAEAMAIIRPEHPDRPSELTLRSGRDKLGYLVYFEGPIGCQDCDAWNRVREKTDAEIDAFLAIRDRGRGECEDHRGPAGAVLHYHVSERQGQ